MEPSKDIKIPLLQSNTLPLQNSDAKSTGKKIEISSMSELSSNMKKIQISKTVDFEKSNYLDDDEKIDNLNIKKYKKKVIFLFDQLFEFETRSGQLSGIYYIIIVMICSSVLTTISAHVSPEVPGLQLLFVIVLINFLINYNLVREGHITPYLESEEGHYKAKWIGILSIIAIGAFFYAIQTSAKQFVMFILLLSWVISALIEKILFKEGYSITDSFSCLIVLGGSVLVNIPLIRLEGEKMEFENDFLIGIGMAILSSLCVAVLSVMFSKLNTFNILSINHVVSLIIMLFIPVFFPLQGLISLGFMAWVLAILLGVLFFFVCIFFIRSLQLEKSTVILLYLNLLVAAQITIETIFVSGILNTIWGYIGAGLIFFGLFLTGKEAFNRIKNEKNNEYMAKNLKDDIIGENSDKKNIELKVIKS